MTIGVVMAALFPALAAAESSWLADPHVQERLAAGEVLVRADPDGHRLEAAVRINAGPEAIWKVMIDCTHAPEFIPGLKRCRRVDGAPDGSWAILERDIKYSWLMPTLHDVLRADYQRPRRIDFRRVSGDLKEEDGAWVLTDSPPAATIVEYQLHVDPGFWIPRALLQHSLRTDLPAAMKALRTRVEGAAPARAASLP